MMNKEIEKAIEALRVGIRNAQAGSRHQEADMTMRAIEGLRDLQQPIAVTLSREEFEKVKYALVLYNTGSSVKHPQIREKGVEALAILNKHGGNILLLEDENK